MPFLIALVVNKLSVFPYFYDNIVLWLKYALFEKKLQISFSASNFGQKSPRGHMSISPGVELVGLKDVV